MHTAQSAGFCDRVVAWGPAEDVPGDGVGDVRVFQFPNVSGQQDDVYFFFRDFFDFAGPF